MKITWQLEDVYYNSEVFAGPYVLIGKTMEVLRDDIRKKEKAIIHAKNNIEKKISKHKKKCAAEVRGYIQNYISEQDLSIRILEDNYYNSYILFLNSFLEYNLFKILEITCDLFNAGIINRFKRDVVRNSIDKINEISRNNFNIELIGEGNINKFITIRNKVAHNNGNIDKNYSNLITYIENEETLNLIDNKIYATVLFSFDYITKMSIVIEDTLNEIMNCIYNSYKEHHIPK